MAAARDPDMTIPRPGPALRMRWTYALRERLSAYLPLLLMVALALVTWWLVKNSPRPLGDEAPAAQRSDPDYTMSGFTMERYDSQGRLKLRMDGTRMRHFPATDRIEIDEVRIRSITADGRVTLAQARQAVANSDGSEVQLLGGAEVTSERSEGSPLWMRGEFLHAFLVTERIRSHLPVQLRVGSAEMQVAGLEYDHPAGRLDLKGPMRAVWPPGGVRR
jgi:lipopolysaccharide export system protein LptC